MQTRQTNSKLMLILQTMDDEYGKLYENPQSLYEHCQEIDLFDKLMLENADFQAMCNELAAARGDFISSDREVVALMLALEQNGIFTETKGTITWVH